MSVSFQETDTKTDQEWPKEVLFDGKNRGIAVEMFCETASISLRD